MLLAREADMEARDNQGNTPLHLAVQHQQNRVVQILLESGADPDNENLVINIRLNFIFKLIIKLISRKETRPYI